MRPFKVGQYVKTPDGIGRVLYFTDCKHQEPASAVVLFGTSASKYPLFALSTSTQEAHQEAQRPKLLYVAIDL